MAAKKNPNMNIYEQVMTTPQEAQKTIAGGRLKGFTDINPMWRIKKLTEVFGPVGQGWYYKITKQFIEKTSEEAAAFVEVELYVKYGEEWSMPIVGTGGASFIAKEKYGTHMSDECFKMALTDALGIACKALGFSSDIYFAKDRTKYDITDQSKPKDKPKQTKQNEPLKTPKISTAALIKAAEAKFGKEDGIKTLLATYKKDTKKEVSEVKYISAEYKQKYMAMLGG